MSLTSYRDVPPPEYDPMRRAGRIAARTHEYLEEVLVPGVTAAELDREAERFVLEAGGTPVLGEIDPGSRAVSVAVNDELIHATPDKGTVVSSGDLVSLDLVVRFEGHYADTAVTHAVGEGEEGHVELIDATKSALRAGLMEATAGATIKDVARAIEERAGTFGNVTRWSGHFIGRELHLGPEVPNEASRCENQPLESGMCLAVEPILTANRPAETVEEGEGGTVRTLDGSPGAHFEHTVWVREECVEVLTARSDEPRVI